MQRARRPRTRFLSCDDPQRREETRRMSALFSHDSSFVKRQYIGQPGMTVRHRTRPRPSTRVAVLSGGSLLFALSSSFLCLSIRLSLNNVSLSRARQESLILTHRHRATCARTYLFTIALSLSSLAFSLSQRRTPCRHARSLLPKVGNT